MRSNPRNSENESSNCAAPLQALPCLEAPGMAAIIHQALEAERAQLAAALHGSPLQKATILGLRLRSLRRQADVEHIIELADDLIAELRDMSVLLNPPLLDEFGLVPTIEALLKSTRRKEGIETSLELIDVPEGLRFSKQVELNLYRIIKEALNNVIRHSKATRVGVELAWVEEELGITIQDNGVGFETGVSPAQLADRGGIGIKAMHEEASSIGGALVISSAPRLGTTVRLVKPMKSDRPR